MPDSVAMWERAEAVKLWDGDGLTLTTVAYHAERYPFTEPNPDEIDAVVLMRHGAYRRRADGIESVVDPNTGCFRRRGGDVCVANFTGEPEQFTIIELAPCLLGSLFAVPTLPAGPFPVTPEIDLRHRILLRDADAGDDDGVEEDVIRLVGAVVEQCRPDVVRGSRPTTEPNWRSLVSDAVEVLHATDGAVSLQQLARRVATSPFHLSRVFRAITGSTITQYRLRLRVRAVLDRLSQGEEDLAALANAVGFADHSHMTRAMVAQLGEPPSVLRRRLRRGA